MKWEIHSGDEFIDSIIALKQRSRLYIAGMGKYGKLIGKYLNQKKVLWDGYVDKKINVHPYQGKNVYPYSKEFGSQDFFVVASNLYEEPIVHDLENQGISEDNIIVLSYFREIIYDIYEVCENAGSYMQKIQIFRNCYEGQKCFIIGNGPSLAIDDLDKLKDTVTFACNSIYALYEYTAWRPTFYCAYDSVFCKGMMSQKDDIQRLVSCCKAAFTGVLNEGFAYRDSEEISNLYYVKILHRYEDRTGLPLFSEDCTKQVYSAGTVTYMMLQLAVYMGFQEIYLLGVDATYPVERHKDGTIDYKEMKAHQNIIEKEETRFTEDSIKYYGYANIADVDMNMDGYRSARNYADTHGIKIYNATRGGKLEVFERVDFDGLF